MEMTNVLPPWNHAELILQQSDPHYQTDCPLIMCCKRLLTLYCTDQISLKTFTECIYVIDLVSVTSFNIGTYITPDKYLTPSWKQLIIII